MDQNFDSTFLPSLCPAVVLNTRTIDCCGFEEGILAIDMNIDRDIIRRGIRGILEEIL